MLTAEASALDLVDIREFNSGVVHLRYRVRR